MTKVSHYDVRVMTTCVGGLCQDLVLAARAVRTDRRFTIAAVLALGLAIGINNSVFTLINTARHKGTMDTMDTKP